MKETKLIVERSSQSVRMRASAERILMKVYIDGSTLKVCKFKFGLYLPATNRNGYTYIKLKLNLIESRRNCGFFSFVTLETLSAESNAELAAVRTFVIVSILTLMISS
jgi:hypothetical protein